MADVRLSRKALADLTAIERWLIERDPAAAARVIAAIEHSLGLLAAYPEMGRPQSGGLGRLLVVPTYRYVISYRYRAERVEILFILHPSRDRRS